ncbi:MAG: DUF2794 domain-containing protein [Alphaproteobacteria bacterium]|nr:DUF2794 domain-containing protein [Alphaproteobacteria bacterium]
MGTLLALRDFRNAGSAPFFDRRELRAILALYAEHVSRGEWRDYAIEQQPRHAGFAVFRSSRDWPLYVITKFRPRANRNGDFVIFAGDRRLAQARSIDEILAKLRAILDAEKR